MPSFSSSAMTSRKALASAPAGDACPLPVATDDTAAARPPMPAAAALGRSTVAAPRGSTALASSTVHTRGGSFGSITDGRSRLVDHDQPFLGHLAHGVG